MSGHGPCVNPELGVRVVQDAVEPIDMQGVVDLRMGVVAGWAAAKMSGTFPAFNSLR